MKSVGEEWRGIRGCHNGHLTHVLEHMRLVANYPRGGNGMLRQFGEWSRARFGAMAMTIALASSIVSFAPVAHASAASEDVHGGVTPNSTPCQLYQARTLESENFNDGPSGSYKMTVTLYEQYDVNFGM